MLRQCYALPRNDEKIALDSAIRRIYTKKTQNLNKTIAVMAVVLCAVFTQNFAR
ncbi:hypothetical protein ACWIUD_08750 [Helicobacter sp. 23-1044]